MSTLRPPSLRKQLGRVRRFNAAIGALRRRQQTLYQEMLTHAHDVSTWVEQTCNQWMKKHKGEDQHVSWKASWVTDTTNLVLTPSDVLPATLQAELPFILTRRLDILFPKLTCQVTVQEYSTVRVTFIR